MNTSSRPAHRVSLARRFSRFLVFGLVVVLAVGTLTARLFYLQITNGTEFSAISDRQRTVEEPIPAPRGYIYDRNGRLLVKNVPTYAVKLRPADLPDAHARPRRHAAGGAAADGSSRDQRDDRWQPRLGLRSRSHRPGRRRRTAQLISEAGFELPGVEVAVEARRAVHRRATDVATARLHRPGLRRAAAGPAREGLSARRPARQGRTRGAVRDASCAARTARRRSLATRPGVAHRCCRRCATPSPALRSG